MPFVTFWQVTLDMIFSADVPADLWLRSRAD
nr:hypothetical protein [Mycobacterium sp. CnD-18-1]